MNDVEQLENQIDQAKEVMKYRDMALRLNNNRDFKKLILEGFCRDECARYAQMSADPALSKEDRENAMHMAQAAGHIRRFLSVTCQMGKQAENQLADIEAELDVARAEEADDEGVA